MKAIIGKDLTLAARYLKAGELVGIPTETVYGLAANGLNEAAVVKIFAAKNRPQFNPLILHIAELAQLEALELRFPPAAVLLANQFSPGPLTYLIPGSPKIPGLVTAGTSAVAIRMPDHPITRQLLASLDFPLAAPSANLSGRVSATTAMHVANQLGDRVSYILDGGPCKIGLESTIISFLEPVPRILRYGGIPAEAIEALIGKLAHPAAGFVDNPIAPGMLRRHYATRHPLLLGNAEELIFKAHQLDNIPRIVTISLDKSFGSIPPAYQFCLSPGADLSEAAQKLFAAMRLADEMDIDLIIADRFPETGLGRAINDRLSRASAKAEEILKN